MTIQQIIFLAVFIITMYVMIKEKSVVGENQISQEPLTKKLKVEIWILCLLNPLIAGTILFYGWRKKLPVKAHKANQISLWAFLISLIVGGMLFLLLASVV